MKSQCVAITHGVQDLSVGVTELDSLSLSLSLYCLAERPVFLNINLVKFIFISGASHSFCQPKLKVILHFESHEESFDRNLFVLLSWNVLENRIIQIS